MVRTPLEPQGHTWDSSKYQFIFRDEQGNLVPPDESKPKPKPESSGRPASDKDKKSIPKPFA